MGKLAIRTPEARAKIAAANKKRNQARGSGEKFVAAQEEAA